jgi:hypothetical protein
VNGWKPLTNRILLCAIFLFFVWAIGRAADAEAHYQPGVHNTRHAVNLAFCGKSNSYCGASSEAWSVARCETGGTMSVWANNGQYLGLFQMGSYARAAYGHSANPWGQARAAHRYYVASGRDWSPWDPRCRP